MSSVFDSLIKKYSQEIVDDGMSTVLDPTQVQVGQAVYDAAGQEYYVVEDDPTTTYKTLMPSDQSGQQIPEGVTTVEDAELTSEYTLQNPQGPQTASIEPEFNLSAKWVDTVPGGVADDEVPRDFPEEELEQGMDVEFEHTDDPQIALEIAMDHLMESYEYYDKLEEMEKRLKREEFQDD